MKDDEIMKNRMCDVSVSELAQAIKMKEKETPKEFEDWTDLETISEWRERVQNRKSDLKKIGVVKITKKLRNEFTKNYYMYGFNNPPDANLVEIEGIIVSIGEPTFDFKRGYG